MCCGRRVAAAGGRQAPPGRIPELRERSWVARGMHDVVVEGLSFSQLHRQPIKSGLVTELVWRLCLGPNVFFQGLPVLL